MTDACYLAELGGAQPGDLVVVSGAEGRHAAVVKRTRVGEKVLVSDGRGAAIHGEVVEVGKQQISVRVTRCLSEPVTAHRWTVVQALAKGDRQEVAVESLTELGVARIVAWQAARSIVRWDGRAGAGGKADKGVERWQATARESTKQSRRFRVPKVEYATSEQLRTLISSADLALVCHEDAATPLAQISLPERGEVVVVIGPEGGLTVDELSAFQAVGGQLVSLGDGVLRTSSAGVVALAQLQVLADLRVQDCR